MKISIPLYGGFARTETLRTERNPEANVTVLSGDIGQDDTNTDDNRITEASSQIVGTNSTTVVRFITGTGTARIDGFTITSGSGTTTGGGLYITRPGLTVANCRFIGNKATSGGGAYVSLNSAVFTRCGFSGNTATNGGAAYIAGQGTVLTHCGFSGNNANQHGGAVHATEQTQTVNCLFHSNTATTHGGAWYQNGSFSTPVIAQCTMTGNSASLGGAFYSASGQVALRNSILWGNTATGTSVAIAASIAGSALPTVSRCDVAGSGGSGAWNSLAGTNLGGNLDANPLFLGTASPSAPAPSFRPLAGSPVIDAGSAANLPTDSTDLDGDADLAEAIPVDLAGDPRSVGATPDMGVFETGSGPAIIASVPVLEISPNSGTHAPVPDLSDIFDATAQSFALVSVTPTTIATVTVNSLNGEVSVTPLPDATGVVRIVVSATNASGRSNYLPITLEVFPAALFVDTDATGNATGLSWQDAFPTLQDALVRGGSSHEIWVAEGVYFPDQGGGQTPGNMTARFVLPPGITLRGGFAGTETSASQADPSAHPTVLSADLGHDDINTDGNQVAETTADRVGSNASGILTLTGTPADTGVDGFILTAGSGGALRISGGSPFVRRCRFSGNSGSNGGAVLADTSATPAFTACVFSGNVAGTSGGAVRATGGSLSFEDCSFTGNTSNGTGGGGALNLTTATASLRDCTFSQNICPPTFGNGGAIRAATSVLQVVACLFRGNEAYDGGALHITGGTGSSLTNCLVIDNLARSDGGAAYLDGVDLVVTGCGFAANIAAGDGGALYHYDCSPVFSQCSLAGNTAGQSGGAIYNRTWNTEDPAAPVLRNCILWGNQKGYDTVPSGASVEDLSAPHATTYSNCIIAHSGGSGAWKSELGSDLGSNLDADPRFLMPPAPGAATPQSIDLRVQAGSPAINSGNTTFVAADVADVDDDGNTAETLPLDPAGKPRIAGTNVDIGAYESEPGPGRLAPAPRLRYDTFSGTHHNVLDVSTLFDSTAVVFAIETQSSTSVISAQIGATIGDLDITVLPENFGTTLVVVRATDASGHSSYQTVTVDVYPPAVFVNTAATGSGSGLSWQNAFTNLQAAVQFPRMEGIPLEIWVAQGVYHPDEGPGQFADDANSAFLLSSTCRIYGGFAGNETQRSERDPLTHLTILSGDLAKDDLNADGNSIAETTDAIVGSNAYTVLGSVDSGAEILLDGLTITAGDSRASQFVGGGMTCHGGKWTLVNCRFHGNRAILGGGIYARECAVTITACRYSGNLVRNSGTIYATYGGAAFFYNSTAVVTGSRFESNRATHDSPTAAEGGAVSSIGGGSLALSDSDFIANTASGTGGSVAVEGTALTVSDCRFAGSTTTYSSFSEGGALSCVNAPASLIRCRFTGNSSGSQGGAFRFSGNHPLTCSNTIFSGNSAGYDGGAVLVSGSQPIRFTQCLFTGNASNHHGGGVCSYAADAVFTHCTFTANRSVGYGGAFCQNSTNSTDTRFINSVFWANQAAGSSSTSSASVGTEFNTTPTTRFRNCIVANSGGSPSWNPASGVDEGGNLGADPVFLMPLDPIAAPSTSGDFRLGHGSAALDTGDNAETGTTTDLSGAPRITNGIVDMGAYEGQNDQFDLDGDGLSDAFELSATSPPSRTALEPSDDGDNDGWNNLMEFAFGLDPWSVDHAGTPQSSITGNGGNRYLTLRYRRNRWALQFLDISAERSLNLGSADPWNTGETIIESVEPMSDNVDEVSERSLSPIDAQPAEFIRVRIRTTAP